MQREWRRFDGRIWSRVEFLQCQRSRRIFTVGITVFLRFSYRITQSNGKYLLDWSIDWLVIWCFVLHQQCFGHITTQHLQMYVNYWNINLYDFVLKTIGLVFFLSCWGWVCVFSVCSLVSFFNLTFQKHQSQLLVWRKRCHSWKRSLSST